MSRVPTINESPAATSGRGCTAPAQRLEDRREPCDVPQGREEEKTPSMRSLAPRGRRDRDPRPTL